MGFSMSKSHSSSASDSVSSVPKKISCFFNPSTCQRQSFSIPEKIVYYIAKNGTNGKTFRKLVQTCKYFFKVNPVIVVYRLECYGGSWYACYDEDEKYFVGFKYGQEINFKIWVTHRFRSFFGNTCQLIPLIYKNDATVVYLGSEPLKFEEFLFIAGNAKELITFFLSIKYENGETVQLEDVVKHLPKLKSLNFQSCFNGSDVNSNTARKLMETEHLKNISKLELGHISEALDVEEMFKYICENKHIQVKLSYRRYISDACKELIREYSNRLKNEENVCNSEIKFDGMDDYVTLNELSTSSSSDDDTSDTSFDTTDNDDISSDDDDDSLLFPWKNEDEEEWELPWDKNE